jgi:type IV secretion system protein TrbF
MLSLRELERRSPHSLEDTSRPPEPSQVFQSLWANEGKQRQQFFVLALLSLSALVFVLVAYAQLARASRFVPFLYVVDRSGEVLALGAAKPLPADTDTVTYLTLEHFISGVRAVYRDPLAQRAALQAAYAYLPGPEHPEASSGAFLETYLSNNDPRTLAERLQRTVEIVAITKLPARPGMKTNTSTWRIRWRETSYPLSLGSSTSSEWEAFALVRVHPKKVIEAFDRNPFGIYIDQISWSRLTPENRS